MESWFRLRSMAAALMVALAASPASANLTLPGDEQDEKSDEKTGGNAIDNAAAKPAASKPPSGNRSGLSSSAYEEMAEFWGLFLGSGTPFVGALEAAHDDPVFTYDSPSLQVTTRPTDAPAESILDAIDESQAPLPMVGEPGSQASSAAGTGASAAAATPPPESILDFIDTAPAPQPAVSTAQDAAKPAVNQAPKPAVVETPPQ